MHILSFRCWLFLVFACVLQIFIAPLSVHAVDLDISTKSDKKIKIAICYWGLTRSTKKVYKSHYEHLFNVLDLENVDYDVFIHTWHTDKKQRVWNKELDIPIDYQEYMLLNPTYYKIDNQDDFTKGLVFSDYFYQNVWDSIGDKEYGEWWPELILNHLCALESQKRVTDLVIDSHNYYDYIMYVRPDALLNNDFPIKMIDDLQEMDILLPNFDHFEGYNDRFAMLHYNIAPNYGKRIDEIIHFRQTQGRIVSEKYVKYICDKNNLNAKFAAFHFDLIRP